MTTIYSIGKKIDKHFDNLENRRNNLKYYFISYYNNIFQIISRMLLSEYHRNIKLRIKKCNDLFIKIFIDIIFAIGHIRPLRSVTTWLTSDTNWDILQGRINGANDARSARYARLD